MRKNIGFFLTQEEKAYLKRLAKDRKTSMTHLLRTMINFHMIYEEKFLLKSKKKGWIR